MNVVHQFEILLSLACEWAAEQERIILQTGLPLNESQLADAKQIAVTHPERIRLLRVPEIPQPTNQVLLEAAKAARLLSPTTDGMTVRYGIFIREHCWGHPRLITHELVHTKQYEQRGGFAGFLRPYLLECLTPPGYPHGQMEQEAIKTAEKIYPK